MARYRGTVPSSRSAEETFDYLARFSSVAEWDPGAVEAADLGDGAPVGVGSKFKVVTQFGPARNELVYEVTEYERPRRVRLVADASSFTSDDLIEVHEEGAEVSVTYTADLRMKGVFKLAEPFMRIAFKRVGDRAADGLRSRLAKTAAPASA